MGQCGCGDGYDYRLKAPKGWYLIKLYQGCKDCDTPAGIHIDWEKKRDFAADLPTYPLDRGDDIRLGRGLPIISASAIRDALKEHASEERQYTAEELCDFDNLHWTVLLQAVGKTMHDKPPKDPQ